MKITNKLTLEYLKRNKKRSIVTITRNSNCYYSSYNSISSSFKLSRIYDQYS